MTDWLAGHGFRSAPRSSSALIRRHAVRAQVLPVTVHHLAIAAAYLFLLAVIVVL